MLGLALDSVWSLLSAPTLTKEGHVIQACVSALYYALILNRSSEFSMPGCYYCPNVLTIIVCRNLRHQKVFLLNVMKFITRNKIIPLVWDARQIFRVELRSGWDCSLLEMDMAIVYHLDISENWRAIRCMGFFSSACPVISPPSSIFSSSFLQMEGFFPIVLQFYRHDFSQFKSDSFLKNDIMLMQLC